MVKVIAVANQKGGVGKTTTSVNISACLGVLEKKILLIDADPQANATSSFGINDIENGTYQCLEHQKSAIDCIQKSSSPNVDVMPAQLDLVAAELELVDKESREFMLKEALNEVVNNYDYIIIDCAPSLGLITINALTAADSVIVPIQCEYFALEGLGKLMNTIKSIQNIQNPQLDIEGLLLTMYDSRLRLSNLVIDEVKTHFQDMVFKTIIQRNVRLSEAPSYGESIIMYDATCRGAINYLNLAQEFIDKMKLQHKMAKQKKALGRGLSAILSNPKTDITQTTSKSNTATPLGTVGQIKLNTIQVNPFQPRTHFNKEALKELALSIKELGVIQPITVRKLGYDKFQLISGERRFRASKLAGLKTIPAFIRVANDQEMLEMALVENIQRKT